MSVLLNLLGYFSKIIPEKHSLSKCSAGSSCQQHHCDFNQLTSAFTYPKSIPSNGPESSLPSFISALLACFFSLYQRIKWNICSAALWLLLSSPLLTPHLWGLCLFEAGILSWCVWNTHLTGVEALLEQVAVKPQLSQTGRSACPQHCKYLINLLIIHSKP